MSRAFSGLSVLLLAGCATVQPTASYQPVSEAEMKALMAPLASDAFEGRMSGTPGEQRTVDYLVERLKASGVAPGLANGSYEQRFDIPAQKMPDIPEREGASNGQSGFAKAVNALGATSSRNVVGVVRGRKSDGKAVVLMAHWDHLGICRPNDPVDRICNGAVDNASGVAAVLAVAARLKALKLDRDVYVVLTGAEEWGLLGAKAFAATPPVPLANIVAAFNLDTISTGGRGQKVAMLAPKGSPLEPIVREAAAAVGRTFDADGEADGLLKFQDGWALADKGVPSALVGGAIADFKGLMGYLTGNYHAKDDELTDAVELGGAADDVDLQVELIRRAASRSFRP